MDGADSRVQIGNRPSRRRCIDVNGVPLLLRAVQSRIPKPHSEEMVRLHTESKDPEFCHHKYHQLVNGHGYRKYMAACIIHRKRDMEETDIHDSP